MEMTITRGLNEIKLLTDRIAGVLDRSLFIIAHKKSAAKVDGIKTKEEFAKAAESAWSSINALRDRRSFIKAAIVASNATTTVTISGKTLTVADAIERKKYLDEDKYILSILESQLKAAQSKCNSENMRVDIGLENFLTSTYGQKDQRIKIDADTIKAASDPYLELNQWVVHNPLNLEKVIADKRKEIEDFENEVDFALSESNSITKIVVPD